jgi:hypothetical protein
VLRLGFCPPYLYCIVLVVAVQVFYLGYGGLKQVDLSDDQVVAAIATDDWENAMKPVEVRTADVRHGGWRSRQCGTGTGHEQIAHRANQPGKGLAHRRV